MTGFSSRLRGLVATARVGTWLGGCFLLAFATGLISHWAQVADPVVGFPTRPVWGYRLTQTLHVAAGSAAVPLLLVKLWLVYPRLLRLPPRDVRRLLAHAAERASTGVLVSASLLLLATGLANVTGWYPWRWFSFRATHHALGWIAVGALAVHVAMQATGIRDGWRGGGPGDPGGPGGDALSRRGLLRATWLAAAVAVVTTATAGVPALRRLAVLAPRSGDGPQGLPVNRSARAAGVVAAATSHAYRLTVTWSDAFVELSRSDLTDLPQRTENLPIACVEGWSASGEWTGVRLRDLLDLVGAPSGRDVRVVSLEQHGHWRRSRLPAAFADDPRTLLALRLGGDPLSLDHGAPVRLIAPNRPGVRQTKWVTRVEVL